MKITKLSDIKKIKVEMNGVKDAYKQWIKYLYTKVNPYTGIPLKDDPALAIIQVKNEDGVFFWTMQAIKPELRKRVGQLFYEWVIVKYGNIQQALATWSNTTLQEDDLKNNVLGIYNTWDLTQDQSGGKARRITDQVDFFTQRQHAFYAEMNDYIKHSLNCKQLTNGNNWKTADSKRLNDLERYTNTTCDVLAVNRYFDPVHFGENNGWRIDPGHTYVGPSALRNPHLLPINLKQVKGHPIMVTESGWNLPHKYQAEGPFLIAAYQSLTGVDGFYWFNPSAPDYMEFPYFGFTKDENGQYAMNRWTCSVPGQIGMFPANALAFRMGYIAQAKPVVKEKRTYSDMIQRVIPQISEEASFDPNRDFTASTGVTNLTDNQMPLAFLTGPVQTEYATSSSSIKIVEDLSEMIDPQAKRVVSATGQIALDYENGICTVDAQKTQGVTGFLSAKHTFELRDVTIISENDYATINVVSMDGKNLTESEKIFVQVGTVYRPNGWEEVPVTIEQKDKILEGFEIIKTGQMPWKAATNKVKVRINNPKINRIVALNPAGYPIWDKKIILTRKDNTLFFTVPEDVMYLMLDSTSGDQ